MVYQSNIEKRLNSLELERTPPKETIHCWIDNDKHKADKLAAMEKAHPDKTIFAIGWRTS